jgi:hypothetical protein
MQGRGMVIFAILIGLGLVAVDVRDVAAKRRPRT